MKKTLLFMVAVFATFSLNAEYTNLIKGGNMETAADWDTANLENKGTVAYTFNYTDTLPTGGEGGCLDIVFSNPGGVGTHIMFYQNITFKKGHHYIFNLDAVAVQPMSNSWLEVYVGDAPIDGKDYSVGNNKAIALGGYKFSGWSPEGRPCNDNFDGKLSDGCLIGSGDTILFHNDTIKTIGFKVGIWDKADATVEIAIDNVTLYDLDDSTQSSVKTIASKSMVAYVANNELKVSNVAAGNVSIFNLTGQVVKTVAIYGSSASINVSTLPAGIYVVKAGNQTLKVIK